MNLYRYSRLNEEHAPPIILEVFVVVKESGKSYFISIKGKSRVVSKTARKRFAYPTIEEAKRNFIKRTELSILFLKMHLKNSELFLQQIEKL